MDEKQVTYRGQADDFSAGNDLEMPFANSSHHKREATDFREGAPTVNPIVPTKGTCDGAHGGRARNNTDDDNAHQVEAQDGGSGEEEEDEVGGRTNDQAMRLRILQLTLALVGVSLKGSPCGVHALQIFSLLCQLGVLWSLVFFLWLVAETGDDYSIVYREREDSYLTSAVLIMVAPLVFLHYVAHSEECSKALLAATKTVVLKWWHVAFPLVPPLGLAVNAASFSGWVFWFYTLLVLIFYIIVFLPSGVGIMVCFVYAQSFTDALPREKKLEDLKEPILRHMEQTQERIKVLNKAFVLPNITIWLFYTFINLWELVDFGLEEGKEYSGAKIQTEAEDALWFILCVLMMLVLVLPPSEYTKSVESYVLGLVVQHCDDSANMGYFHWLEKLRMGWTVFSVEITRKTVGRLFYLLVIAAITVTSRFLH